MNIIFIIAVLVSAILLLNVYIKLSMNKAIYFTIIMIFFPIHIQFLGKDALTTGTILILVLYSKYLFDCYVSRSIIKSKYDMSIYLFILLITLSNLFLFLNNEIELSNIGPALRQYLGFVSSMLLFIVIKNSSLCDVSYLKQNGISHIEKILTIIVFCTVLHVIVAVLVKFFPSFGGIFKIFLSRDSDTLEVAGAGGIERIRSFVFNYEQFGEFLAVLCPVVIYKIFQNKGVAWVLAALLMCLGVLLSVTRSGIVLFGFGFTLSILYYSRQKIGKGLGVICGIFFLLVIGITFNPGTFDNVFFRFEEVAYSYSTSGSLFEVINRDNLPLIWESIIDNISLFGHSVIRVDYHNLFLTSLHQFGIIGAPIFLSILFFPAYLLFKIYKKNNLKERAYLIFPCILSFLLFFINEIKFEFIRQSSYMQICFALFGSYFLILRYIKERMVQE